MNVLAHAFTAIYTDFALLEPRITGQATPAEAVAYVVTPGMLTAATSGRCLPTKRGPTADSGSGFRSSPSWSPLRLGFF